MTDVLKGFRPPHNVCGAEMVAFLQAVRTMYRDVVVNVDSIFEPRAPISVADLSSVDMQQLYFFSFVATCISTERKNADGQQVNWTFLPRSSNSLKLLAELPLAVVLASQLYKQCAQLVQDLVPLALDAIMLRPSATHRSDPRFNQELLAALVTAQVKTLACLAYLLKSFPVSHFVLIACFVLLCTLGFCIYASLHWTWKTRLRCIGPYGYIQWLLRMIMQPQIQPFYERNFYCEIIPPDIIGPN